MGVIVPTDQNVMRCSVFLSARRKRSQRQHQGRLFAGFGSANTPGCTRIDGRIYVVATL